MSLNTLKILGIIFMFSFGNTLFSIETNEGLSNVEKYEKEDVDSEFETLFKDEDLKNFKKLREFKSRKEDLLKLLEKNLRHYFDRNRDIKNLDSKIGKLTKLIEGKNDNEKFKLNPELMNWNTSNYGYYYDEEAYFSKDVSNSNFQKTKSEIKEIIEQFELDKTQFKEETEIYNRLIKNIKNVEQDIYDCNSQIDSTLAPEYKQQEFRTNISICFTILIGVLLIVFFFIVYVKSDNNLSKELLSGNGLQFITLFVLIIAVILFGILSILQGSELAAILSGISGYILGKGVINKTETA